jgi:small-conductance mechanosensitive channel
VANSRLLSAGLKNYRHMTRRRVVLKTSVVYRVPPEKLKRIPGMLKAAVERSEKVVFDRSNLYNLGDSSMDFETVYFVESPDYAVYMNTQEQILRAIVESFAGESIEFAYPTQTLFVNK